VGGSPACFTELYMGGTEDLAHESATAARGNLVRGGLVRCHLAFAVEVSVDRPSSIAPT
jgi:hypothetical protein